MRGQRYCIEVRKSENAKPKTKDAKMLKNAQKLVFQFYWEFLNGNQNIYSDVYFISNIKS